MSGGRVIRCANVAMPMSWTFTSTVLASDRSNLKRGLGTNKRPENRNCSWRMVSFWSRQVDVFCCNRSETKPNNWHIKRSPCFHMFGKIIAPPQGPQWTIGQSMVNPGAIWPRHGSTSVGTSNGALLGRRASCCFALRLGWVTGMEACDMASSWFHQETMGVSCIYIYIYTYVCIYMYMYIYIYTYEYMCIDIEWTWECGWDYT